MSGFYLIILCVIYCQYITRINIKPQCVLILYSIKNITFCAYITQILNYQSAVSQISLRIAGKICDFVENAPMIITSIPRKKNRSCGTLQILLAHVMPSKEILLPIIHLEITFSRAATDFLSSIPFASLSTRANFSFPCLSFDVRCARRISTNLLTNTGSRFLRARSSNSSICDGRTH